jgi:hypothetical protein
MKKRRTIIRIFIGNGFSFPADWMPKPPQSFQYWWIYFIKNTGKSSIEIREERDHSRSIMGFYIIDMYTQTGSDIHV